MYERICNLCEDKDLVQIDMAQILSCSQRVYSDYERGMLDIPTEILIRLSNFHDTTTGSVLGRTDVKAPLTKAKSIMARLSRQKNAAC